LGAVERLRELGAGREILGEIGPREKDGLLVSHRNADLTPEGRRAAPAVFRALLAGQLLYGLGERKSARILKAVRGALEMEPGLKVEAVDVVEAGSLRTVEKINGSAILIAAAWAGSTLLADSVLLEATR